MKSRTLIFSIYLLMLAVYPCSDGDTCVDEGDSKGKIELTSHDHSQDESDQCTPFCICSCCSANMRLAVNEVLLPVYAHNTLHIVPYIQLPLLNNAHAIWQPPKLS